MALLSHFERLNAFLAALPQHAPKDLRNAFANEVIECGGTWTAPPGFDKGSGAALFEISLHGITALGTSEDHAIQNWIALANSYRVPFPSPRNHAEEIANAQAVAGRG